MSLSGERSLKLQVLLSCTFLSNKSQSFQLAKFSLRDPPPALDYLESINSQLLERSNIISNSKERRLFASEDEVSEIVCDGEEEKLNTEIERLMNVTDNASSVISGQSLFSVYVHPGPTYNYTESSIFYRKEVEERVDTKTGWGTFKLVEAELSLIRAALKDKRNKKFVLLSESCIPLHPPEVIYAQIISEKKSRLKACENQLGDNIERYTPDLNGKYFNRSDWRKSNQWFCLNRAHAEFIVNETYLRPRFKEHCNGWHGLRQCISDEHYIASALGIYGFGNQTDCQGASTYVLFNGSLPHPITFGPEEINPRLLIKMRQGTKCNIRDAWSTTVALLDGTPRTNTCLHRNFSSFNSSTKTDQSLDWVEARGYKPLDSSCYLFARKFPGTAVRETLRAALACMGGGLGHWC
eukprot:g4657.t1